MALLDSTLERTCYVFKNSEKWNEDSVPEKILEDRFTQQLTQACEVENFPPDVKLKFVRNMFTEMDYKAETKAYYKDGFAEGRAEGMREKALEAAQKFLAAGVPAETVAFCTGLSVDEIREMRGQ